MDQDWIKSTHLCRYYKYGQHQIHAVDDVNLNIGRGDFVALVGASGSGKSTLLNLLAGLDSATSGHIEFEGRNLSQLTRRELSAYRAEKVGMIFQSFNLLGHQTALKNVEIALYFSDIPRTERRKRADAILRRLGLGDRLDHLPADLSGGEQQRVAIARALVKKPEIIFADEPTGNLDRENSDYIANLLTELNWEGLTIIMATHDISMAKQTAGKIIKLHYGRIVDDKPAGAEI